MGYEQLVNSIRDRWTSLLQSLEKECDNLGRSKPVVVAVSKTRSLEEVQAAIDVGITDFGENYAREFERKAKEFPHVSWHYIGHLQRNDANSVVPYAKIIHTLDRKKLTRRLLHFDYIGDTFIQVNISQEASKSGIMYSMHEVTDLLDYSRKEGLQISGLMTIGSLEWDDRQTENEYTKFANFTEDLGLPHLSLGMSGDWQLAVRAGSTHLRIGTAIFGART
jgi:pyridoxal phosphate enzyme (YggS family)